MLEDHLRRAAAGDVEGDIAANYAPDVVIVDRERVRHGHGGVRDAAAQLDRELPDATYEYVTTRVAGEIGYLVWRGAGAGARVCHGTDTFVIRDGLIRAQTFYYRVIPGDGRRGRSAK